MRIAVPKETAPGERRVALVPESCKKLMQAGYEIAIEAGAADAAGFGDQEYTKLGVTVVADPAALLGSADLVLKITAPAIAAGDSGRNGRNEVAWMRPGAIYVGSLMPLRHLAAVRALAARKITAFATDAIPRTTRAQSMDTLSSMANLGGYKGVLLAAVELNRYFPMLTTAAGMVFPAKVFVIGAGVAGLQAIATAKRLGANVVATDVRPEVKEQIESVGAKYVGIELGESAAAGGGYAKELSEADRKRQAELLAAECAQCDVVITTALIGGVFAPRLISADVVKTMKPGSVIVDLGGRRRRQLRAVEAGRDRPSRRRDHSRAAQPAGHGAVPREPAVLAQPDGVRAGVHERQGVRPRFQRRHPAGRRHHARRRGEARAHARRTAKGGAAQCSAPKEVNQVSQDFWSTLFVFVLASFIGLGVIRRVSRLLHTPLMSLTNAISAIAIVGAILMAGGDNPIRIRILGAIALFASMTNIVSGFLITDRMLKMFKAPGKDDAKAGGGHS